MLIKYYCILLRYNVRKQIIYKSIITYYEHIPLYYIFIYIYMMGELQI
jgi:hypothetical protein